MFRENEDDGVTHKGPVQKDIAVVGNDKNLKQS